MGRWRVGSDSRFVECVCGPRVFIYPLSVYFIHNSDGDASRWLLSRAYVALSLSLSFHPEYLQRHPSAFAWLHCTWRMDEKNSKLSFTSVLRVAMAVTADSIVAATAATLHMHGVNNIFIVYLFLCLLSEAIPAEA